MFARILLTAICVLGVCAANAPTIAAQSQDGEESRAGSAGSAGSGAGPWHDPQARLNPFPEQRFSPTNGPIRPAFGVAVPQNPHLGTNFANYYKAPGVRVYADMRDAGARHDRITFDWFRLQPTGPSFDAGVQQAYDSVVSDAGAASMELLGVLIGAPDWAKDGSIVGGAYGLPRNLNLPWNDSQNYWGQFVYQTVQRYKSTVRSWEAWNEPNLGQFWPASPQLYARLMQVTYQAAKAADPTATVVLGSIYRGLNDTAIKAIFAALRDLDPSGANAFYHDVIGFHLYDGGHCSTFDEYAYIREFFWKPYVGDKPVWVTESGIRVWDTPRYDGFALPSETPSFLLTNYAYALAHGVQRYYVFRAIDPTSNDAEPWGLLKADGTPRPSLVALRVAAQYLPSQILSANYALVNDNAVQQATFYTPQGRTTVTWNITDTAQSVLIASAAPTATLVTQDGAVSQLDAVSGSYVLNLDVAQNSRWNQGICQVASAPLIVIEQGVTLLPRQWLPFVARAKN